MGSGTTGYAALSLGRHFAGFDVVEEYVAQANSRLHAIAGGKDYGKGQET
jgi:DNA modification methylase